MHDSGARRSSRKRRLRACVTHCSLRLAALAEAGVVGTPLLREVSQAGGKLLVRLDHGTTPLLLLYRLLFKRKS